MVNFGYILDLIKLYEAFPTNSTKKNIENEFTYLFQKEEYARVEVWNGLLSIGIVTEEYFQNSRSQNELLEGYLCYLDQVLTRIVFSRAMEDISLKSGLMGIYYYYLKRYEGYLLTKKQGCKTSRDLKFYYEYILSHIQKDLENFLIKSKSSTFDFFSVFFLLCRSEIYQFKNTFIDIIIQKYIAEAINKTAISNLDQATFLFVSYFVKKCNMQIVLGALEEYSVKNKLPQMEDNIVSDLSNLYSEIDKWSSELISEKLSRQQSSLKGNSHYDDLFFLSMLPKLYPVFQNENYKQ